MLSPTRYYRSVRDIDLNWLTQSGIDTLLVDLDNTLLARNSGVVPDDLRIWAQNIREQGFKVCLVSNNWHERVFGVASALGFELVPKAVKPLPFAFLIALGKLGSARRKAVVIGDQMFTDILGGKLLGMTTILVTPLSESDLPHTLALRRLERLMLADRQPLH